MNRIFEPRGYITVPDGTDVSAFLNATDATQENVPWGALGEMSIASGRIGPGVHSWVHVHPAVTLVTYSVSGSLTARMKDVATPRPYDLQLRAGQATVSEAGTLLQLRNDSLEVAEVLYIASPSYVFEKDGESVVYDDAILVSKSWEELEAADYEVPALRVSADEARARRAEARRRLASKRGHVPLPLAAQSVVSVKEKYDYLAPDGSEIRPLASGEHGGFAHCRLPAGTTSTCVRHRTVEELWYVLEGSGEIWRGRDGEERVDPVRKGDSVRIPVAAAFQFRADPAADLELVRGTMPPWPGCQEAVDARGGFATAEEGRRGPFEI